MTTDFLYDEFGDIAIDESGDLVLGDVTFQNVKDILLADKGWFRFDPYTGAGITDYINNDFTNFDFTSQIQRALEMDGVVIKRVSLEVDVLMIEANYGRVKENYVRGVVLTKDVLPKRIIRKESQSLFDLAMIYNANIDAIWQIFQDNYDLYSQEVYDYEYAFLLGYSRLKYSGYSTFDVKAWGGVDQNNPLGLKQRQGAVFPNDYFTISVLNGEQVNMMDVYNCKASLYFDENLDLATMENVGINGIGNLGIGTNFKIG